MNTKIRPDVDGEIGQYWVEVKAGVQSIRALRDANTHLAYKLAEFPSKKALLVLPDLQVSRKRLSEEKAQALLAFRPDVMQRLYWVVDEGDLFTDLPAHFSRQDKQRLREIITQAIRPRGDRLPRIDGYFVLLKLMILQWLRKGPPMTAKWLSEVSGYSYPTVAKAISRLSSHLKRYSDRRVELNSFPQNEWARLLAVSDQVRSTVLFTDASGQPRPVENLMHRLRALKRSDIAIGGVYGADHYVPELDIVGSPRLDLTLFCPNAVRDLSFIKQLDPALEPVTSIEKPVHVAIHVVRGNQSFSDEAGKGMHWADPVECLLDLHEARLESQALEFLNTLIHRRENVK